MHYLALLVMVFVSSFILGCAPDAGPRGTVGPAGARGADGKAGVAGPAGAPAAVDGSRLVARWRTGADGSRGFVGWRDTMLDVDCSYALASDGEERCLPGAQPTAPAIVQYSDDACTHALVAVPADIATCDLPAFVQLRSTKDAFACSGAHVFAVGAAIAVPTPPAWQLNGAQCESTAVLGSSNYYDLGTEIAPSMFVAVAP